MTKLEQLYNSIETLKGLGLKLDTKLLEETSRLEEEIIKNDVIPLLEEKISPLLSQIKRELVLVIDYLPDEPLSVSLSRRRTISIAEETIKPTTDTRAFTPRQSFSMSPHSKSAKTTLSVKFPDGKVICQRFAYQTLIDVIELAGVEKVQAINIVCRGMPLVSNKRDDFYRQEEIRKGVFVITQTSTQEKKQQIEEMSQHLKLGLKVDIV